MLHRLDPNSTSRPLPVFRRRHATGGAAILKDEDSIQLKSALEYGWVDTDKVLKSENITTQKTSRPKACNKC